MGLCNQYDENEKLDRVTGLPWGRPANRNEAAYTVALFTNALQPIGPPFAKLLLPDLAVAIGSQFLSDANSPYTQQHLALHVAAGRGVYSFRCGSDKVIVVTGRPGQGGHYAKRLQKLFKNQCYSAAPANEPSKADFTEAPDILGQTVTNAAGIWKYEIDVAGEPVAGSFRYLHRQ